MAWERGYTAGLASHMAWERGYTVGLASHMAWERGYSRLSLPHGLGTRLQQAYIYIPA